MKIYGPYERADGRKHVIHYDEATGKRKTQSYPRYLVEQVLGRALKEYEHVDHIDGDLTNNAIENLQLLSQKENNRKSIVESGRQASVYYFTCPRCKTESSIPLRRYLSNQVNQGKAGPFCSRACAGRG